MSRGASLPRLDDRYELADRTGLSMGGMPFGTLQNMIRQGRLFQTDQVSKNGGDYVQLGELEEFQSVFGEVLPPSFKVDGAGMRPLPEIAGELDALSLAGVFARLYRQRRTGRLFTRTPDGQERVIIFRQGVPVNAMSNIEDEWLGEVLINRGLIDADDFTQAVELRRKQGHRLGSALVYLDKLSTRELHRALSMQAMERLLNMFRQAEGSFQFVPDDSAAEEEILLLAGPRDIIETGLSAALAGREVTELLAGYGDPVFRVAVPEELAADLSESDKQVLEIVQQGEPLSASLAAIARAARLTAAEARLRVLTLLKLGVLSVGDEAIGALEATLEQLQSQDFFNLLDVRRAASPGDVEAAYQAALATFDAEPRAEDGEAAARARARIKAILEKARKTLGDPDERDIYNRSLQLGLDFEQPEVRRRLEHEHLVQKGKTLLAQQQYAEALRAFRQAAELVPEDPAVYVHAGWAGFLGSARDRDAASDAIREVERALKLSSDLDLAYLTIGKIHRLAGDLRPAEDNLRRAIELNPHNHEAQSELRLLFTREIDKKGPQVSLSLGDGAIKPLLVAAVVLVGLYAAANLTPGGATVWPDVAAATIERGAAHADPMVQRMSELNALRLNYGEEQLVEAAKRLGADEKVTDKDKALEFFNRIDDLDDVREALKTERKVPPELQVMGNLEYFYVPQDTWWWGRRAILLVVGLLGILLINRESLGSLRIGGERVSWAMAAIPYGAVVGFLSPKLSLPTELGTLLGMTLFHVLAEQLFFIAFLGRGLLKKVENPILGIGIVAVLFGAYHATYFAILQSPGDVMIQSLLQISVFAGGAYAFLLWRSGGLLAPFLAHLLVNGTMMIRTIF